MTEQCWLSECRVCIWAQAGFDFPRARCGHFEVASLRISQPAASASEPWGACRPLAGASRLYMCYGRIDWQRIGSRNGVPALRLSRPTGCPILKHCAASPNHENLWSHAVGADTLYRVSTTRTWFVCHRLAQCLIILSKPVVQPVLFPTTPEFAIHDNPGRSFPDYCKSGLFGRFRIVRPDAKLGGTNH